MLENKPAGTTLRSPSCFFPKREWWRNQPLSMVCACVCHVACCASACVASKKKKTGLTSRIRRQTCFDHKQTIEISVCGICKCKWRILELMLSAFIHSFIHSFIYSQIKVRFRRRIPIASDSVQISSNTGCCSFCIAEFDATYIEMRRLNRSDSLTTSIYCSLYFPLSFSSVLSVGREVGGIQ